MVIYPFGAGRKYRFCTALKGRTTIVFYECLVVSNFSLCLTVNQTLLHTHTTSQTHIHTQTHPYTRAYTHAHTHAHTHARTHEYAAGVFRECRALL